MGPSKCGKQPETVTSELDDLEGLSLEQLQAALAPTPAADTLLGAQQLANAERADWAGQWASEMQHDVLEWPDGAVYPQSVQGGPVLFRQ